MSRHARGIPVSGGIAIGPGWIYRPTIVNVERRIDQDPEIERRRLVSALAAARDQISRLRQATREQLGQEQAAIFEAHLLILEDPEFIGRINDAIAADRINAEAALAGVVEEYAQMMLALSDEYFQARAQDIRDVGHRLLCCLSGAEVGGAEMPDQPVIVLAEDLTPSDTVQFDRARVLGLCTLRGGPTSHTAILARSLGVPAVVNLALPLEDLHDGVPLILDGSAGELIIDPVPEEIGKARRDRSEQRALWAEQLSAAALPAATTDGRVVEVAANIGSVEDARQAIDFGAEGVGLLRTEFLYLNRERLPSLEEQVGVYQEIFTVMGNRPVVVRTLDIGGDKAVDYLGIQHEPNPFLGWRAIRMIDEKPEILRDQFSALLLAGRGVDLRIMIPLVASLEEVLGARQLFDQACQSLQLIGRPVAERAQFGIMIEVPSAALLAGHLAEHVDFFSIGTNDLAQYTLAVDRTNERVAHLASPFHPAVLNLIAQTIQAAHSRGKWVGLCGEMAGDPRATPLLLGLGLDEFSMAPASIPIVKQRIRQLAFKDCREIAAAALKLPTTRAVLDYLDEVTPSAK